MYKIAVKSKYEFSLSYGFASAIIYKSLVFRYLQKSYKLLT